MIMYYRAIYETRKKNSLLFIYILFIQICKFFRFVYLIDLLQQNICEMFFYKNKNI